LKNGNVHLKQERRIAIGGRNLIYRIWNKRRKPIKELWVIDREELIQEATNGMNSTTHRIFFYYKPYAENQKGLLLIEPMKIYAYTYEECGKPDWTILFLKMKELINAESNRILTRVEREKLIKNISGPIRHKNVYEFLYLQGEDGGWKWGMVGNVNAALIYSDALNEFKKYL
jgi:hypothetical protein